MEKAQPEAGNWSAALAVNSEDIKRSLLWDPLTSLAGGRMLQHLCIESLQDHTALKTTEIQRFQAAFFLFKYSPSAEVNEGKSSA